MHVKIVNIFETSLARSFKESGNTLYWHHENTRLPITRKQNLIDQVSSRVMVILCSLLFQSISAPNASEMNRRGT